MHSIGIDLGTTHTVAAANAGVLPLRSIERPNPILPSVVAYVPSGEAVVGAAARERRAIDPKNTIYAAKRVIGESWHAYRTREFCANYPFDMVPHPAAGVAFKTRAGLRTPVEVASMVLRALCAGIEADAAELDAVVSVPVAFGPSQRAATLEALRAAGFGRARCIAEPVATALAYLDRSDVRYGAVYDLGGGTFDFAIVRCDVEPMQVVASGGDAYLGGDDVDHALAGHVAERVLRERGWDLRGAREVFAKLVLEAERAKVALREKAAVPIEISLIDPAAPPGLPAVTIDRTNLLTIGAALIKRTFLICDDVLQRAGLTVRDLQAVFMAGGATLMPGVRESVAEYFGRKLRHELDPMHVVSVGASMAAARPRYAPLLSES
jgi:molecular chaperone DnaK